jgi:hypothetical protein
MFGGRKGRQQDEQDILKTISWPQLPSVPAGTVPLPVSSIGYASGPPALPTGPVAAAGKELPAADAEQELLDKIGAFRGAVADALYELSNDYRILCNLAHADLKSCEGIMEELRERLAVSVHYQVLAKLDEAYALTEAHIARDPR